MHKCGEDIEEYKSYDQSHSLGGCDIKGEKCGHIVEFSGHMLRKLILECEKKKIAKPTEAARES